MTPSGCGRSSARAFPLAIQPSEPFRHSLARLAGYSNDVHITVDMPRILFGGSDIEWHIGQQVDFIQNQQLRLKKIEGYLSGLSSPSVTLRTTSFAASPKS